MQVKISVSKQAIMGTEKLLLMAPCFHNASKQSAFSFPKDLKAMPVTFIGHFPGYSIGTAFQACRQCTQ